MSTLYDKIKYDHKHYSRLTDHTSKQAIEKLAALLKSIAIDIATDPDGQIVIDRSGYIYITDFHPEVAKKVTKLLAEK